MSQENAEIAREISADQRGLIGAASQWAAPDVEFDFTHVYPDRPVLKGVEEMRRCPRDRTMQRLAQGPA